MKRFFTILIAITGSLLILYIYALKFNTDFTNYLYGFLGISGGGCLNVPGQDIYQLNAGGCVLNSTDELISFLTNALTFIILFVISFILIKKFLNKVWK